MESFKNNTRPTGTGEKPAPQQGDSPLASMIGPDSKSDPEILQALSRGLAVLASFGSDRPSMTIAEAARATGLTRATVRRVLFTLASLGYAEEDRNRRWSLTARVLELGFSYLSSIDIWELAYPFMRHVSEVTGEACSVTVLDGDSSVYVARVPANRVMSVSLGIGSRLPAWVASHGRVLLCERPEEELERYLRNQPRKPFTEDTIWEIGPLMDEIRQVREQGYALVTEELEAGLMALAVPIRDRRGQITAALHISSHSSRTSAERARDNFLQPLQQAAENIRQAMI